MSRQSKVVKKHEVWFLFSGKPVRFSLREFAIVPLSSPSPPNISEKPYWGVQDEGFSGSEGDNSDDEDEDKKGPKSINPAHVRWHPKIAT